MRESILPRALNSFRSIIVDREGDGDRENGLPYVWLPHIDTSVMVRLLISVGSPGNRGTDMRSEHRSSRELFDEESAMCPGPARWVTT